MSFGMMEAVLSFFRRQVGLRTDSADASGSLHAKTADIRSAVDSIAAKDIINHGTVIKSIQRGTVQFDPAEMSKTVTISSVTTGKTKLNFLGAKASSVSYTAPDSASVARTGHHFFTLQITNSTTITIARNEPHTGVGGYAFVSYEVIEYY